MTNEQAKEIMEAYRDRLTSSCSNQLDSDIEAFNLAIKALGDEPQGEWVGNAFNEHHCNRCGHPALWEEEPDDYYEVQSRFCPNCGLPMKI